ncbi:AraC family transcriptional regulator [Acinetobacter sp. ANC 3903]|uniref:AraC family transcriptional regulator n=1 Tax=Acinetobacter sp. ANC 3903 TaxID=1977883 RepID=UPI000A33370E|nr:AraC family transcriptional regulator [Acinetobacter sp. ANC 3903]OTG62351.1 AraC family transcriptional regulator [Acinetobacter sp. ANC 3903]
MQELHIPNGYFQLWNMYLIDQGLDFHTLEFLAPYRDDLEHVLQLPIDTQSPFSFFYSILQLTREQLDCPQLIIEMAKRIRPEHFGVLGYMATRSNSVAEALQYIMRFSRLVIDGADATPLQMHQQGNEIWLSWPFLDEKYALLNEMTMAAMVHLAKQIFPDQPQFLNIQMAHRPQMAQYHYQKFYGCDVLFDQPRYAYVMGVDSLTLKSVLADPSLMQLLLKQAEEAIALKPHYESVLQQIHTAVAEYLRLHAAAPKIDQIADELHVSTRTLQRQLQQLESSFKAVLESERMKRCEQLLQQNSSLTEIAMRLGYSDQSALARAYKAYSGQTLLERKQQLKAQSES